MSEAYPKNVAGPFYIENGCCITCGVPVEIAPALFSWDDDAEYPGHCFVSRQPANATEVDLIVDVMKHSEVYCLRYRGKDGNLKKHLIRSGYGGQCD